jgi:hypothetical protein
MKLGE